MWQGCIKLIYIMASGQKWMKRACAISSSSGSGRYDKWREWWLYSGGRHWPHSLGNNPFAWKLCPRYAENPVVFTLEKFHTTFTLAWKRRSGRRFSKCFKRIFIYLNNVFLFLFFFSSDKNVNFAIFHGINLFDYPSCIWKEDEKDVYTVYAGVDNFIRLRHDRECVTLHKLHTIYIYIYVCMGSIHCI